MKMQMKTEQAVKRVLSSAQKRPELRDCRRLPYGRLVRQGDVYIGRVDTFTEFAALMTKFIRARNSAALMTAPAKWVPTDNRQLAPGHTKGSRHIVGIGECKIYAPDGGGFLVGPRIEADGTWELNHPEHAAYLFGRGCHFVSYQLDARTLRRVQD